MAAPNPHSAPATAHGRRAPDPRSIVVQRMTCCNGHFPLLPDNLGRPCGASRLNRLCATMLAESLKRVTEYIPDSAKVLDVGGWARPLNRADWVLDLMPYDTRGMLGHDGDQQERFASDRWVQRDICARAPWPFD